MNCSQCAWFGSDNDRTVRKRCPSCGTLLLTRDEQPVRKKRKNMSRWRRSAHGNAWRGWRVWKTR